MSSSPRVLAESVRDRRGRTLHDLRISVTDRCNFRCRYCMPREQVSPGSFLERSQILSFEEVELVARSFVELGVRKIRLTGGEPLLRKELPRLVQMLSALGVELALTTNGVRLPDVARALKQAGLHRITVSLDALDEAAFQRICDAPGFRVSDVLQGIEAAERAGFEKLKINCVVQRGQNEDQVEKLFSHFKDTPHELRFIEFMDVGTKNAWASDAVVTKQEILTLLRAHGEVVTLPRERPEQVAEKFRIVGQADASGRGGDPPGTCEVGVISSVSEPFCGDCSRARLSADGQLFSCLFASSGVSLRTLLRSSSSASEVLTAEVRRRWEAREDRYSEARAEEALKPRGRELPVLRERVEMSFIGG